MTTHPTSSSSQNSTSVFDRLYSKSTESSRLRKSAAENETEGNGNISASKYLSSSTTTTKTVPHRNKSRPALKSKTNMVRSQKKNGSSEVYNRLYSKGTASYNSKRKTVVSTQSQSKTHGEKNVQMK
mmetsp:Transcript_32/g.83  ORF Transcript_32/g.83 Transcript_32/m.83 type:complete len:127 (+) Transcript_32:108-488(+)